MNVRGVKRKGKKKKPIKPDNPAQSAKFIASAKELGLDRENQEYERFMDKLSPHKSKLKS